MSMAIKYAMKKRMAKGGDVGVNKADRKMNAGDHQGVSQAGAEVRKANFMREGVHAKDSREVAKDIHYDTLQKLKGMRGKDRTNLAEGGMVEDDDMVDRIMRKRCAEGGEATRDEDVLVDFLPNEFDEMELEPAPDAHYEGADVGDEQEDEDRHDMVSRIMRSRSKRDRMPRPA